MQIKEYFLPFFGQVYLTVRVTWHIHKPMSFRIAFEFLFIHHVTYRLIFISKLLLATKTGNKHPLKPWYIFVSGMDLSFSLLTS